MTEAADTAELDPDRLSFIRTLNVTGQVAGGVST
jgi:hypothetical protein